MISPAAVGDRQQFRGSALDNGDELDEVSFNFIPEETVHLQGVVAVGGVHSAQDVEFDIVLLHQARRCHHMVEGALTALIDPVGVVHMFWPIQ